MPVHNGAGTVMAAVKSTLRAMPESAELLIYDDASSDGTLPLLRGVRDRRLRVVAGTKQEGVAASLNLLLSEARAEVVARMDADDYVMPGRFALQLRQLRQADMVFGSTILFGRSTVPRPTPPIPLSSDSWRLALAIGNPVAHSTFLGRKKNLMAVGGYRKCLAEDYDLWLRMAARNYTALRGAAPVVALRQHRGQVTADRTWARRAAEEPEWQASYAELASSLLGHDGFEAYRERVNHARTPGEKAMVLSAELRPMMRRSRRSDRIALRFLARRAGISL
jgi:glycosyltransferase involved in cell wall biosynthesis